MWGVHSDHSDHWHWAGDHWHRGRRPLAMGGQPPPTSRRPYSAHCRNSRGCRPHVCDPSQVDSATVALSGPPVQSVRECEEAQLSAALCGLLGIFVRSRALQPRSMDATTRSLSTSVRKNVHRLCEMALHSLALGASFCSEGRVAWDKLC